MLVINLIDLIAVLSLNLALLAVVFDGARKPKINGSMLISLVLMIAGAITHLEHSIVRFYNNHPLPTLGFEVKSLPELFFINPNIDNTMIYVGLIFALGLRLTRRKQTRFKKTKKENLQHT